MINFIPFPWYLKIGNLLNIIDFKIVTKRKDVKIFFRISTSFYIIFYKEKFSFFSNVHVTHDVSICTYKKLLARFELMSIRHKFKRYSR